MTTTRRLPINVAPARHELLVSYLARLASLHGLTYDDLWEQISAKTGPNAKRILVADALAHLTGRPRTELAWAMPQLRQPAPDWRIFRHEPQPACPACTARHPGGQVFVILPHHRYVCVQHRLYYMVCILSMSDKGPRNSSISQTADFTLCLDLGFS